MDVAINGFTAIATYNTPLNTNTYIEIPQDDIKDFRALTNNNYLFKAVQQQYLDTLDKLAETCRPFAEESNHLDLDYKINDTKKNLTNINLQDISVNKDKDLFFSYTLIRKALIEIEEFLTTSDDQDKKIIIYSQLYDGFGVCVQGFNTKVFNVYQQINRKDTNKQDINHELYSRCNDLIKNESHKLLLILQRENILEKFPVGDDIHAINGVVAIAHGKLNFNENIDSQFALHDARAKDFTAKETAILSKLDYPITRYKICSYLADIFYQEFTNIITNDILIPEWLTRNIDITELTTEHTDKIDLYFCSLINNYFNITDTSLKFSLHSIIEESQLDDSSYSFANIKDTLHKFIATNIDKFPHNMLKETFHDDRFDFNIYPNESTTYCIKSINSGYFYKFNPSSLIDSAEPINMDDLCSISDMRIPMIARVSEKLRVPIIIQALENENSSVESIYKFFNNQDNINALKNNKDVKRELLSSILYSEKLTQKISKAIHLPYTIENREETDKTCEKFFIDLGFISGKEFFNSLIRKKIISIKTYISEVPQDKLYKLLNNTSTDNLKTLVTSITPEDKFIDKLLPLFQQCIQKNSNTIWIRQTDFNLLNTMFESDILLTKFLTSENFKNNTELDLDTFFQHKQDKLLSRFLLSPAIDIKKFTDKNILHYATICQDKQILEQIISKLSPEEIQEYLIHLDDEGLTPLGYAAEKNNSTFCEILEPFITREIILSTADTSTFGGNTLECMLIHHLDDIATQLMQKLTIEDIKSIVSDSGDTLLMMGVTSNETFINALLSLEGIDDEYITRTNEDNENALMLAINENNYNLAQALIAKCQDRKLFVIDIGNGKKETSLSCCFYIKDTNLKKQFFNLLFEFYKTDFPTEKDNYGSSLLHLAVSSNDDLDILKEILPYCDKQMLTDVDADNMTALHIALEYRKKSLSILLPYYNEIDMLKSPTLDEEDILIDLMRSGIELSDNLLLMFDDKILKETTQLGNNLLLLAIRIGNLDWVKKILPKYNILTILKINESHNNILHMAIYSQNLEIVNYLLNNLTPDTLRQLYLQSSSKQKSVKEILQQGQSLEFTTDIKVAILAKIE